MFSFKPIKAPSSDGLHPMFYKKYWNVLRDKAINYCKKIFQNHEMNPAINITYLCLILKCANAIILKNFRHIWLCNTMYKLMIKIIVNRIKPILPSIIGPSQASFLSNRRASDNAIIVQKYISHFKKMKGKNANMILKIDLKKSF